MVDKKRVYNAVYIFPPSPLPINSHNSLRVTENTINTFESARAVEVVFPAWSVNYLDFFWPPAAKFSGRHQYAYEGTSLRIGKVFRRPIRYCISSHFG